jgi:predicted transcriptional regulator
VIPVEDSVTDEAIVCLFDGVKKLLKRYIRAKYGMEEHEYKAFFGMPADYPMVALGLGSTIDKTPRHLRVVPAEALTA